MPTSIDLIGDIHGHAGPLHALLETLGYHRSHGHWRHGEGRRLVFLGDYIDRGPEIPLVLRTVRELVDDGIATALMGNHEFNAIAWATPLPDPPTDDPAAAWCRPHSPSKTRQHEATLHQLPDEAERAGWVAWFRHLPVTWTGDNARACHACWHPAHLIELEAALAAHDGFDDELVVAASGHGDPLWQAVETVLKGLEVPLPDGQSFTDKDGTRRTAARVQWWRRPAPDEALGQWLMPPAAAIAGPIPETMTEDLPLVSDEDPATFIGHYWLPPGPPRPLATKLACLDYSIAKDGMLVAYRLDEAGPLEAGRMVAVEQVD